MRRSILLGFLMWAMCFALGARPSQAQTLGPVVYDNGLTVPTPNNVWFSDTEFSQWQLQRFTAGSILSIGGARWWGAYLIGPDAAVDDFTVRIYDFSSGVPNTTPIHTFAVGAANRTVSGTYEGGNHYQYEASFSPFTLGPGTYGFSVQNNLPGTEPWWFWSEKSTSNGGRYVNFGNEWSPEQPDSVAFQLTAGDTGDTPAVPEPGSFVLILPALTVVALVRRRPSPG